MQADATDLASPPATLAKSASRDTMASQSEVPSTQQGMSGQSTIPLASPASGSRSHTEARPSIDISQRGSIGEAGIQSRLGSSSAQQAIVSGADSTLLSSAMPQLVSLQTIVTNNKYSIVTYAIPNSCFPCCLLSCHLDIIILNLDENDRRTGSIGSATSICSPASWISDCRDVTSCGAGLMLTKCQQPNQIVAFFWTWIELSVNSGL